MYRLYAGVSRALFLAAILATGTAAAHEGHDHEAAPTPIGPGISARAEASSDSIELVAVAEGNELLLYIDRFTTNEPVEGAVIEAETPTGTQKATGTPGQPYRVDAPWLTKAGRVDLIFTITTDGLADILPVTINIPNVTASAQSSNAQQTMAPTFEARARGLLQTPVIAAGALGLALGLAIALLARRRRAAVALLIGLLVLAPKYSSAHEGEDHSGSNASAIASGRELAQRLPNGGIFVPKPIQRIFGLRTVVTETAAHRRSVELPGRIIPDPNASGYVQAAIGGRLSPPPGGFPRLGTAVRQGDVLAYVTPPLQAIDVSDMRQKQGELEQQISIVERRLARYEQLVPSGAVARSQLEDTKTELQGLRDRRAALDKSRREPEALISPVNGVIADGAPVAGQIAQTNAIVFHIIDPARLWVEALSFDAVATAHTASALAANGRTFSLSHRGSGLADRSQSIPIHFAIEGNATGLRAGQFVTVLVATQDDQKQGIAIPRAALVRSTNGQDLVYEHVGAERFEPRVVRVDPLDGERVLVSAGIQAGKRIVVQGAELLDHVR